MQSSQLSLSTDLYWPHGTEYSTSCFIIHFLNCLSLSGSQCPEIFPGLWAWGRDQPWAGVNIPQTKSCFHHVYFIKKSAHKEQDIMHHFRLLQMSLQHYTWSRITLTIVNGCDNYTLYCTNHPVPLIVWMSISSLSITETLWSTLAPAEDSRQAKACLLFFGWPDDPGSGFGASCAYFH